MSKNSIIKVFPENSWIPWETSDVQASFFAHDRTISNKALLHWTLSLFAMLHKQFSSLDIGRDIKITYIAAPLPRIYRMLVNNFIPLEPSMRECTASSAVLCHCERIMSGKACFIFSDIVESMLKGMTIVLSQI